MKVVINVTAGECSTLVLTLSDTQLSAHSVIDKGQWYSRETFNYKHITICMHGQNCSTMLPDWGGHLDLKFNFS